MVSTVFTVGWGVGERREGQMRTGTTGPPALQALELLRHHPLVVSSEVGACQGLVVKRASVLLTVPVLRTEHVTTPGTHKNRRGHEKEGRVRRAGFTG